MMLALRNSLTCGPARWTPMSDPNIAVYLDPSLGRTDVAAAVANASDLSAAGWTPTGLSARTATTITDDGSNGEHCVAQTVAGVNLKHATTVSFTIPAGSTRYIAVSFDNAAAQAVIDTQAPASIAFQTGWNATATLVGGVFTGIRTTVTNGALKLYAANGAAWANTSYAGASNIAGAFTSVTVTQPNASALADQTGNGRNILQAVAANRPAVVDASGNPWGST
jgi:hypothetical protein